MKKKLTRGQRVDGLYLLGAVLVSAGVGLLLLPAGMIAAGCFALVASILVDRSGAETGEDGDAGK